MSYPTQPAFIHEGDWDAVSDSHPAMKWMHMYTGVFENEMDRDKIFKEHLSPDYQFVKSDGTVYPPGRESFQGTCDSYQFFTKYYHEPYFLACYERQDGGYDMTGNAWVWASLPGGSGEGALTDKHGNKWDVKVPAGFFFGYKKDGDSFRMDKCSITSDSGPIVVPLLQRGVIKPSNLGL